MCRGAACQRWHLQYALIGWIPTDISVAVIQIRAHRTAAYTAEHDWPFAEDLLMAGSPVFR